MADAPESEITPAATPPEPAPDPPVEVVTTAPAPVQAALPDFEADPLARAALEKVKAEEVAKLRAEADAERKQDLVLLEAKLRAEADEQNAAAEAERMRVEEMSATERMQEQIAELGKRDAAREASLAEARREAAEAGEKLVFVRAIVGAGMSLAKQDPALEDLAHNKAKALIAGGLTMPEAITKLATDDSYLFSRPAAVQTPSTSTAAGSSAPRGSTSPARAPSQGAEVNALRMPKDEWGAYSASKGYMDLVTKVLPN